MKNPLDENEILKRLKSLDDWKLEGTSICKQYTFPTFMDAMQFMLSAAQEAENMDHHPDWSNVYRKVDVRLTTHEAESLTELDFMLAGSMDKIFKKLSNT